MATRHSDESDVSGDFRKPLLKVVFGNRRRSCGRVAFGGHTGTTLGLLLGITPRQTTLRDECRKAAVGLQYGVKTITDVTLSGEETLLQKLLELDVAVGTVPIYAAFARNRTGSAAASLFKQIERHVQLGVDFFSIHPSLSGELLKSLSRTTRVIPITSRGGAMVAQMMQQHGCDNPFLTIFDELLHLCAENSVALSFVASLRPGSIADLDSPEYASELNSIARLADTATKAGVATIVELVNHVPLHLIPSHIASGRQLFPNSALGALGPTPTDIAVGLDDIAGSIGAAVASSAGIDWINLITAGEHSHLPSVDETIRALGYFRLALHIGSLARGGSEERDRSLSLARAANDWQAMAIQAIDVDLAKEIYEMHNLIEGRACSMCGCACPLVKARRLPIVPVI
jgi:phosphomethylpyrimidine synthase